MVDTTNYRQTTYKCYPIVPGGKSAWDKNGRRDEKADDGSKEE